MSRYQRTRGTERLSFPGAHKAMREVLNEARAAGAVVHITGSGHYQIRTSNGTFHAASTPRDPEHEAKRLRFRLRAKGVLS